jgi:GTPase SAR1 family protein
MNVGAHGVFLVYDITNEQSLESIKNFWLGEVQNYG